MKAAIGAQDGFLEQILGVVAIADKSQRRGIERVQMWHGGLLKLQPLIAMHAAFSHSYFFRRYHGSPSHCQLSFARRSGADFAPFLNEAGTAASKRGLPLRPSRLSAPSNPAIRSLEDKARLAEA